MFVYIYINIYREREIDREGREGGGREGEREGIPGERERERDGRKEGGMRESARRRRRVGTSLSSPLLQLWLLCKGEFKRLALSSVLTRRTRAAAGIGEKTRVFGYLFTQ